MKRRFVVMAFVLFPFTLAFVISVPRSRRPQSALSIRIAGVAAKNSSGRIAVTWSTAVPRPRNHSLPILDWSVQIEETNKNSVQHSAIRLSPSENDLMSTPHLGSEEDGILHWGEGQTLSPEKVYRVIGAYHQPNRL